MLRDSNASTGDKLRAQQRIDDLFSLEQPRQVRAEITGANGGPLVSPAPQIAQIIIVDNGREKAPAAPCCSAAVRSLPAPSPPEAAHVEPEASEASHNIPRHRERQRVSQGRLRIKAQPVKTATLHGERMR